MTTAKGGTKRPVGRPTNSSVKTKQKNTLNSIFAATSLDPALKKKKTQKQSTKNTRLLSEKEELSNNVTHELQEDMIVDSTENKDGQDNAVVSIVDIADVEENSSTTITTNKDSMEITDIDKSINIDSKDPDTPTKTNSSKKKRTRKRGNRGKKKSAQRTLFEDDSREFVVTNINRTRFDISFKTEEGPNAPELGQQKIQELLEACQDHSDESVTIIPWKESDIGLCPLLEETEDVPKQLSQMKIYLPRFRPSVKGGINYTSIFFGHDCSTENLLMDISFWLADSGFKIFRKSIQAEASVILGWFLYGIKEINTGNLQDAIFHTDGNPTVGLRQMRIRTAVTGKASNTRAMGIECDARDENHVKSCLVELYHSKQANWPQGIKLRYMRDPRFLCGAQALNKTKHLLGRHERFQEGIIVRRSRDIQSLDITDNEHEKSLRDIIMGMKSNSKPTMSVFHSVDPAFNQDDTYVLTFLPEFESQADQILSQLVPYVKHLEGEYVTKFFSSEALSKSEGCEWDVEKGCATSALDKELEEIEDMDDGYDFANPIRPSNVLDLTNINNNPTVTNPRTLFGNDTDSISTMGTKLNPSKKVDKTDTGSAVSSLGSNISLRSKASIISSVKKELEAGLRDSIALILKEELAKMVSAPSNAGDLQTNGQNRVTPSDSVKETNATPSSEINTAGPGRGAGQA